MEKVGKEINDNEEQNRGERGRRESGGERTCKKQLKGKLKAK